eukprot:3425902-Rhodomonas_salina.4
MHVRESALARPRDDAPRSNLQPARRCLERELPVVSLLRCVLCQRCLPSALALLLVLQQEMMPVEPRAAMQASADLRHVGGIAAARDRPDVQI